MANAEQTTSNYVRQISSGLTQSLLLWREIRVLSQSHPSMSTGEFQHAAASLEATLQSGEVSVRKIPEVAPEYKRAVNNGDEISRQTFEGIIENQRYLVKNLEDIKRQLTLSFHGQFSPTKVSASPSDVLDVYTIRSLRDTVLDHVNSTSRTLQDLSRRIERRGQPEQRRDPPEQRTPGSSPSYSQQAFRQPNGPSSRPPPSPEPPYRVPNITSSRPPVSPEPPFQQPSNNFSRTPATPEPPRPFKFEPTIDDPPGPALPTRKQPTPEPEIIFDPTPTPKRRPAPPSEISVSSIEIEPRQRTEVPRKPITIATPPTIVSNQPGIFCTGALRLQRNRSLTIGDIIYDNDNTFSDPDSALICRYCNLEVGETGLSDAEDEGDVELVRQHILACASLTDRRAMFRCLQCEKMLELDFEFRTAADFKAHLRSH